jgi:hypothetical protein
VQDDLSLHTPSQQVQSLLTQGQRAPSSERVHPKPST